MADTTELNELRAMTVELATSYASNANVQLDPEGFQKLIRDTFDTLAKLSLAAPEGEQFQARAMKTKAEVRKSITADALISFEDGQPYKMLKRHLTGLGLTPAEYRDKHGLPADYPMVARNYSAARSQLARNIGLGKKGRFAKAAAPAKSRAKPSR